MDFKISEAGESDSHKTMIITIICPKKIYSIIERFLIENLNKISIAYSENEFIKMMVKR
jgi:hypothetical protein